jgi:D-inositol-3-phosphate glycosyltransferase
VKNAVGIGEPEPRLRLDAEKSLVTACHRIVASSDSERRHLIVHYQAPPGLIRIVPCGVNLGLFRPIDKKTASRYLDCNGEKIVLYVGRINALKGVDQLLGAMALLNQQKVKLVIVGGGEQSCSEIERLNDQAERLEIQRSVVFEGLVKQELLPYYYSAADVCVVPSYYESFGLVTLESLACGTPVVATKVGCAEHAIRDGKTGYLVVDNTPATLADAIKTLLVRSGGEAPSPESVRESITSFTWDNMARTMEKEYRSVFMAQRLPSSPCSKQLEASCRPR